MRSTLFWETDHLSCSERALSVHTAAYMPRRSDQNR